MQPSPRTKVEYDIVWSSFDQLTNLQYLDSFRIIEDDTNQDGDDLPVGDDQLSIGLRPLLFISSNGNAVTHRSQPELARPDWGMPVHPCPNSVGAAQPPVITGSCSSVTQVAGSSPVSRYSSRLYPVER